MTVPAPRPPFGQHDAPDGRDDGPRVVEVEVLHDGQDNTGPRGGFDAGGRADGRRAFFYSGSFGGVFTANGGTEALGGLFREGCLAPGVTCGIALFCLVRLGFLAALGFVFFPTLGSALGFLRNLRQFGAGRPTFNPWPRRTVNWLVSFLLTAWLAGGLD
ncbi:MAG: hypothetical protein J5960_07015 [Desulfovibrio sp.]|nr:hypothetical protein [Desulfovibrio sp.]